VTADVALTQQKIIMLDQPCPGARHKVGLVEHGYCFPAKVGDEPTFRMRREFAASEQPECRCMMLKQGPSSRGGRTSPRQGAYARCDPQMEDVMANPTPDVVSTARCFGGTQYVFRHRSEATGTDMRFAAFVPRHPDTQQSK
jgi:hypothetical protein